MFIQKFHYSFVDQYFNVFIKIWEQQNWSVIWDSGFDPFFKKVVKFGNFKTLGRVWEDSLGRLLMKNKD